MSDKLRDAWEEQFDKKFVSEPDGPLKTPDGYDTGKPNLMWKVHPNGQRQLALPEHFKEFIRAIRADGTVGGIRAALAGAASVGAGDEDRAKHIYNELSDLAQAETPEDDFIAVLASHFRAIRALGATSKKAGDGN